MFEYFQAVRLMLHGHDFQLPVWLSADRNLIFYHATHSAQAGRVPSLRMSLRMIVSLDIRI
jgi:hypothetical protein